MLDACDSATDCPRASKSTLCKCLQAYVLVCGETNNETSRDLVAWQPITANFIVTMPSMRADLFLVKRIKPHFVCDFRRQVRVLKPNK